jgi:hypothetical protein
MGSGAKSYMRKGFLKYEEYISPCMRMPLVIYDFASDPSEFPYIQYEEKKFFSFLSVYSPLVYVAARNDLAKT